jgi:hypothetical protein
MQLNAASPEENIAVSKQKLFLKMSNDYLLGTPT